MNFGNEDTQNVLRGQMLSTSGTIFSRSLHENTLSTILVHMSLLACTTLSDYSCINFNFSSTWTVNYAQQAGSEGYTAFVVIALME